MSVESRTLKIKLWFNGKGGKELVCLWQEAISIYFWVIGMLYYQERHNRTVKNYRSAQTPCKSLDSLLCLRPSQTFPSGFRGVAALSGQIYPTHQIYPITIEFQNHGNCPGRTYPTPYRISLTHWIYPVFIGFQNRVTSPWSDISEPHQIYPTQLNSSQFKSPIRHIWSRSDISDVLTPPTFINAWDL
jgi:hypothetical protein